VPVDLHYLESATEQQLTGYQTIVVPFPLAISDAQAALLGKLARAGRSIVALAQTGRLDEEGAVRQRPALSGLLRSAEGSDGQRVGKGRVWFLPDDFGYGLVANRANQQRTRAERIQPDPIAMDRAAAFDGVLAAACGREPWVLQGLSDTDVEATALTNAQGDLVVLTVNWASTPLRCRLHLPRVGGPRLYGFRLGPDGRCVRDSADLAAVGGGYVGDVDLGPQEACLWRLPAR
jgi:hypothetical protein